MVECFPSETRSLGYSYDGLGRLTSAGNLRGDGTTSYSYDALGRLLTASTASNGDQRP